MRVLAFVAPVSLILTAFSVGIRLLAIVFLYILVTPGQHRNTHLGGGHRDSRRWGGTSNRGLSPALGGTSPHSLSGRESWQDQESKHN